MSRAPIVINGKTLTPEEVVAVARDDAPVEVDPLAMQGVSKCRKVIERLLDDPSKPVVYGLNTGFGSLRNILIERDKVRELQRNLIRSHSCGVGPAAPVEVVRAMMLLRANTLVKGFSGVRPVVIETLLQMLNLRVHPLVPVKGSVGASGDLAPLSHLVSVMIGEGEALLPNGQRIAGMEAMRQAGIPPIELDAKEGLALNNGTQFMTAVGVLSLIDAEYLTHVASLGCALSLEAIKGVPRAFDSRIHQVRPYRGQQHVARLIAEQIAHSEILSLPVNAARLRNAHSHLQQACLCLGELEKQTHQTVQERDGWSSTADISNRLLKQLETKLGTFSGEIAENRKNLASRENPSIEENGIAEATRRFAEAIFKNVREEARSMLGRILQLELEQRPADVRELIQAARVFLHKTVDELDKVVPQFLAVQDDYSFRCTPQVHGTAIDTLRHVREVLTVELNSATDNPLIFPPLAPSDPDDPDEYARALSIADCKEAVISGGNFHGEPVAVALDQACIALAEIGSISERRIFHLTSGHLNNGLPSFLIQSVGLQSGAMVAQYTAAALVSENKTLSHPASVDSIPTCEDAEDHVSMGAFAARKFAEVLENIRLILAIELICAAQGVEMRRPTQPSPQNSLLLKEIRKICPPIHEDRALGPDIERVAEAVRERRIPLPQLLPC